MLFQDPKIGELCQVAGWGRVPRKKYYIDEEGNKREHKGPIDLMEVCVPIVDINKCRNRYLVHLAAESHSKVTELKDFKEKIIDQIDTVYDGMNICAGSNYKDSCRVRYMVCFHSHITGKFLLHTTTRRKIPNILGN